ncbi:hypothetical protein ACQ4LE_007119 [Meloidogyne hapla]|uniref:NR LBD domain-containing protein n=1 Tax=Meloidogyne hapla TaxID=6305 RepID=A0A1I8BKX8_MELHA
MTKIRPPIELIAEITHLLPLNKKWAKMRISLIFDVFLLKIQREGIIADKRFFTFLTTTVQRLNNFNLANIDDFEVLKVLSKRLVIAWFDSQPIPYFIADNAVFQHSYRRIKDLWAVIREEHSEEEERVVVLQRSRSLISLFRLLNNSQALVLNHVDVFFFSDFTDKLTADLSFLDQYQGV